MHLKTDYVKDWGHVVRCLSGHRWWSVRALAQSSTQQKEDHTMACRWNPESVSPTLLDLTTSLGVREKDSVILAEGNTSELLDDNHIVVKASGARMSSVTAKDFVVSEVSSLVELMDSPEATQQDLIAALDAGTHDGVRRRGSIETLVHVAVQSLRPLCLGERVPLQWLEPIRKLPFSRRDLP